MLKTIKENIEALAEIAERTKDLELKNTILNLKEQILTIKEENLVLKEQIALNNQKENLIFKNNMYWKKLDDGSEEGPYCSGCYDTKKTLIRMHIHQHGKICPSCKQTIY